MKILLATDGSAFSEDAARFLSCFDFTPRDTICLFHVVSAVPYEDDFKLQILQAIRKFSPKILKACEECIQPSKANILKEEAQGAPEDEIVKKADDLNADLIVMGSRGVKGIKSLFLGSVTRAVALKTARPMLVTKLRDEAACRPLRVLFATDSSASAQASSDALSMLPFPKGSELTIMNIGWSAASDIPERYAMEINDALKEEIARMRKLEGQKAAAAIDQAKARLSGKFSVIHAVAKSGDPTEEILRTADDLKADIITIGSRGLTGMKGVLGSVSRRVLGRAGCAVLIGKGPQ